jgi:hypothetical protein
MESAVGKAMRRRTALIFAFDFFSLAIVVVVFFFFVVLLLLLLRLF